MNATAWRVEREIEEPAVRQCIAAVLPELALAELELAGAGWDVRVWRCGGLAWRFPRRELGEQCLANELARLPALAGRLPLPIPEPLAIGRAALGCARLHYAHRWLAGRGAERCALDEAARAQLAEPLAHFLRALHACDASRVALNARRSDLARARERAEGHAEALIASAHAPLARRALERLAAPAPASFAPAQAVLVHGDLYARHLLLDEQRRIAAVIDWGDCTRGDAALDLSIAYSLLPAAARERFFAAYGAVEPALCERARRFALAFYGLALLHYAEDVGDAELVREASGSIERALG